MDLQPFHTGVYEASTETSDQKSVKPRFRQAQRAMCQGPASFSAAVRSIHVCVANFPRLLLTLLLKFSIVRRPLCRNVRPHFWRCIEQPMPYLYGLHLR